MTRFLRVPVCVPILLLLSGSTFAENSPVTAPAFEIADVHASAHSNSPFMTGGLRGEQYIVHQATMVDLIARAYDLRTDNVLSGPGWLDFDRYDILARAPRASSPEDLKLMLRGLLSERFHLVVHTDTKRIASYVLRVDKSGLKMKEADPDEQRDLQEHHTPNTPPGVPAYYSIDCKNFTLPQFRGVLQDFASQYLPKPVVDATGLKGGYDFSLHWTWRPAPDGLTIFDAVEKQLGLKLALENYATPVVIVDSVDEKPTPNAPGVGKVLPTPPPAEFEVAVLKPSPPDTQGIQGRINGGQVTLHGGTVQWLMTWAWEVSDDMIVNAPKWLGQDKYDLLAKAPAGLVVAGSQDGPSISLDDLRLMVKKFLADRFALQVHMEERPAEAYTLYAVSPKIKKADPMNRTGCKEGPGPDGKDPRVANPILGRLMYCQNMTMAQFSEQLRTLANGYIHSPILDSTGLKDAYDFTLSFSTVGQLRNGNSGGQAPPADGAASRNDPNSPPASEPSGALSLPDAISRQMGLKLAKERRPVPMLVIDHIEEKPTEN